MTITDATNPRELVDRIITTVVQERATDLHFEAFEKEGVVRCRVDGVLRTHLQTTSEVHQALCQELKERAHCDPGKTRPQDGRILFGDGLDLRLSTFPCLYGESLVLRLLQRQTVNLDLGALGLSEAQRSTLDGWCARRGGLILLTGPTGSGKTTLLYSLLNRLNRPEVNICTIEDPVEYALTGINQAQLNPREGLTFATALRVILRQDPDIVAVGEIRDAETAQVLVQVGLLGKLACSSLHTNNATAAVSRLRDIGLPSFLIGDTLVGVVGLRLVRQLCTHCREQYEPDALAREQLKLTSPRYWRAAAGGCEHCHRTGYHGRTAIYELFEPAAVDSGVILTADHATIRRQALAHGMVTLWQDGLAKAVAGVTSVAEVLRVVGSPD